MTLADSIILLMPPAREFISHREKHGMIWKLTGY